MPCCCEKKSSRESADDTLDWAVVAGLLALSFVPVAAGIFRLGQLAGGSAVTPENARFFAAPWPVVIHIVSTVVYCLLGAFQFMPSLRNRNPGWHRAAGQVIVASGLLVSLTGVLMTLSYPSIEFDSDILYVIRLVVGSAMAICLCLGVAAIRRHDIFHHQAWMMRGYALGLGAGTQVLTHLPSLMFSGIHGEAAKTFSMAAGWVVNLAVAEVLISRRKKIRPDLTDGQTADPLK